MPLIGTAFNSDIIADRETAWQFTVTSGSIAAAEMHRDNLTLVIAQPATSATAVITSASVPPGYGGYKLVTRKNLTTSKRHYRQIEETWRKTGTWGTAP